MMGRWLQLNKMERLLLAVLLSSWWKPSLSFHGAAFAAPPLRSSRTILHGSAKKARKSKEQQRRKIKSDSSSSSSSSSSSGGGSHGGGSATDRPVASFAGVPEDHAHEQFFYDDASNSRLFKIVDSFELPVLLCNPSLAVLAEEAKRPYRLLDRDRRFKFLKGYREFSLVEPFLVDEPYDAVFLDPPFANISPAQLVRCLRLMAPSAAQREAPLFLAYNSDREEQLLKAFEEYPGPPLERKFGLTYRSVRDDTQSKIALYGPKGPIPC
jgi:hypothetical protein